MLKHVGHSHPKLEGLSLVTGEALYTDDFTAPGTVFGAFLRSPHAFARIIKLNDEKARKLPGVLEVLSCSNVDRIFFTTAGQGAPEPSPHDTCLFDTTVRYIGDVVALVAAETEEIAQAASRLIEVTYEVLEPVFDPQQAMEPGSPVLHPEPEAQAVIPVFYDASRNMPAKIEVDIGNVDEALKSSPMVVTGRFSVQSSSHCAMEPHAVLTRYDERGRLVIISTTQVPFHVRRIVARLTGLSISMIRVIKPRIGGGFGGKQEIILEPYAALVTIRTKRPCKIVFSRKDVFVSGRTRHAQVVTVKAGFDPKTGKIDTISMEAVENAGAYGPHSLTVLSNTASKVLPILNKIPHIKFRACAAYTNLPVGGAYRGYGATQGYAAYGQIVDEVIHRCGLDPVEYYKKWCIKTGETSPIFRAIGEGTEGVDMVLEAVGLDRCIEQGALAFGWKAKRALYTKEYNTGKRFKRGVGMGCFMQGSAIPFVDMGSAYMKMNDDGSFNLHIGATDIGTGSDTILTQIAAEVLNVPVSSIIVYSSDTDFTPFDTGAYASSTTYLSGGAVKKCASAILQQIIQHGSEILDIPLSDAVAGEAKVSSRTTKAAVTFAEICSHAFYRKNQKQIQAHASHVVDRSPPPFAAHFTEIEVDTETGCIQVLGYLTVTDCGAIINPQMAEGQVEGALVNGLSYALSEGYKYGKTGVLLNSGFGKYKIFTAKDVPPLTNIILEGQNETSGPFGAKSIAEIAINGPLPVIGNAFAHATGKRLYSSPYTREMVWKTLREEEVSLNAEE